MITITLIVTGYVAAVALSRDAAATAARALRLRGRAAAA